MFPQTEFSGGLVEERLEKAARSRMAASSKRQRRATKRSILRRLAAELSAAFSADRTTGSTATRFPGRQV